MLHVMHSAIILEYTGYGEQAPVLFKVLEVFKKQSFQLLAQHLSVLVFLEHTVQSSMVLFGLRVALC